ncbi:hypothetical protein SynNOUM97013_02619 [Synechococcus sp. NOUM97013]|nr:hypothetical protein SynNOUM97013_02619 [Synechococcus sp. NOUM97013]
MLRRGFFIDEIKSNGRHLVPEPNDSTRARCLKKALRNGFSVTKPDGNRRLSVEASPGIDGHRTPNRFQRKGSAAISLTAAQSRDQCRSKGTLRESVKQ